MTYYLFIIIGLKNFLFSCLPRKLQTKIKQKRFKKLFVYAKKNSRFYKHKYRNIDINNVEFKDIPSTNKQELMENFNNWVTTFDLSIEEIDEFTRRRKNVSKKYKDKYFIYKTSGTTGNPMLVVEDMNAHHITLGVGMVKAWPNGIKGFLRARKENKNDFRTCAILPFNDFCISSTIAVEILSHMPKKSKKNFLFLDTSCEIKDVVDALNDFQPTLLIGYPTFMYLLAKEQERNSLAISPYLIEMVGENLTPKIVEQLNKSFDCNIGSVYACTEGGIMTTQCKCNHQHINEDWLILEPIDENGNVIEDDRESTKVYLTNLGNKVQPLIRYEINDRIKLHREGCECGNKSPWVEIYGRSSDLLEFKDKYNKTKEISPLSVSLAMHTLSQNVGFYQFIVYQNNVVEIRLLEENRKYFNIIEKEIGQFLRKNKISKYKILLSSKTPQFEKSGKYKEIYMERCSLINA